MKQNLEISEIAELPTLMLALQRGRDDQPAADLLMLGERLHFEFTETFMPRGSSPASR